mmetsp:Transcript_15638/g.48956  ORF Transcript_15638/g.48956 Transcript_15638/m.48956 type:complete len:249 (-) Transcript_15638:2543-3289(-)
MITRGRQLAGVRVGGAVTVPTWGRTTLRKLRRPLHSKHLLPSTKRMEMLRQLLGKDRRGLLACRRSSTWRVRASARSGRCSGPSRLALARRTVDLLCLALVARLSLLVVLPVAMAAWLTLECSSLPRRLLLPCRHRVVVAVPLPVVQVLRPLLRTGLLACPLVRLPSPTRLPSATVVPTVGTHERLARCHLRLSTPTSMHSRCHSRRRRRLRLLRHRAINGTRPPLLRRPLPPLPGTASHRQLYDAVE